MSMTRKEAAHVLECGAWWDYLPDDMSDADINPLHDALDVALAALRCDWVDAEKQSPTEEGSYLVRTKNGAVTTARYYSPCAIRPAEWQGNRDVAYWMPMPEPPVPVQPPAGAVRIAKLGRKRIWVDGNNDFVAEVKLDAEANRHLLDVQIRRPQLHISYRQHPVVLRKALALQAGKSGERLCS